MKIHVRTRHMELGAGAVAHIQRRLELSLDHVAARVARATVRILDLNGPRGGLDKACRIEVRLLPTGTVFVEDRDADLYTALDRAAARAGHSVTRALKRGLGA